MPDQLERFRSAVADARSGPALEKALAELHRKKFDTRPGFDSLKTAPRGYPKDHPRIELLRRKGLHAGRQYAPAKWLSTKAALDRIVDVWRGTQPMNRWLDKHVGPSDEAPPSPTSDAARASTSSPSFGVGASRADLVGECDRDACSSETPVPGVRSSTKRPRSRRVP
jgi:hypothetical protein